MQSLAPSLIVYAIAILAVVYGREELTPFSLAALLAFMLAPVVDGLARLRVPRVVGVTLVIAGFVAASLLAAAVFSSQLVTLTGSLSTY